jgi:hypothetical protein
MRARPIVPLLGLLALGVVQVRAQTVRAGPEWTEGRSGGWGNRGDRQQRNQNERRSEAPRGARSVVVPSNVAWTDTGIPVKRGQWMRFEPSGEILLSFNTHDVAVAAGAKSGRMIAKTPMPTIHVGALIGRVNSGKPFSIGDTTQAFQMPASGTLFLGVNDDYVQDNSGNYVVKVWEP